jgi:hypothetical protein
MIEGIDYPSPEQLARWPDCKIPGCPNKSCIRLSSEFCYPHTKSGKTYDELVEPVEI